MTSSSGVTGAQRGPGRGIRYLAVLLGTIGSMLSLITIGAMVWVTVSATAIIDQAVAPVGNTVQRLDTRLGTISTSIESASTSGELRSQLERASDLANATNDALTLVTNNPLIAVLPINTDPLTVTANLVANAADQATAEATTSDATAPASGPAKTAAVQQVAEMRTRLAVAQSQLDGLRSQLRQWVIWGAVLSIGLALWALWAQATLARWGMRRRAA